MRYIVLSLFFFMVSCSNSRKPSPSKDTTASAQVQQVYTDKDTTRTVTAHRVREVASDSEIEPSLEQIMHETIAGYEHDLILDTIFKAGGSTYKFHDRYYCLYDSAVRVPKRYVEIYKLGSFVTHNFADDLTLEKDGKEILKKTILKKDFNKLLYPALRSYATLGDPDFRLWGDSIILHYSISIPLTDVGVGLYAVIDSAGQVAYVEKAGF